MFGIVSKFIFSSWTPYIVAGLAVSHLAVAGFAYFKGYQSASNYFRAKATQQIQHQIKSNQLALDEANQTIQEIIRKSDKLNFKKDKLNEKSDQDPAADSCGLSTDNSVRVDSIK